MFLKKVLSRSLINQHPNYLFSSLVIADHDGTKTSQNFSKILNAAQQLDGDTHVLVAGHNIGSVVDYIKESFSSKNVQKIFVADDETLKYQSSEHLKALVDHCQGSSKNNYKNVIADNTNASKDSIPRIAAGYDSQPITDIMKIVEQDVFLRPIYAGNAIAKVKSKDSVRFMTLRPTNYDALPDGNEGNVISEVENVDVKSLNSETIHNVINTQVSVSDKPQLTSSKYVVSGGRGMGSKDNFKILDELADQLGDCAIGASRAAVDAEFASNDQQVGQTGKIVAPQLYIAVGISGAIQHLAGMKDSKVIVAINKDSEAPIFNIADYGIVGDLNKIVPEITSKLKK